MESRIDLCGNLGGAILLCICLAVIGACGGESKDLIQVTRLTNPDLIEIVDSEHPEILSGKKLSFFQDTRIGIDMDTSTWYPFYVDLELRKSSFKNLDSLHKIQVVKKNENFLIKPKMGLATVISVKPDTIVNVRCKGGFDAAGQLVATIIQLTSSPDFSGPTKPGKILNIINEMGLKTTVLKSAKDGRSAFSSIKVHSRTQTLLFMVSSFGKKGRSLKSIDLSYNEELDDFLLERQKIGIIHPALAETPFIDKTVKPSLLMPPRTSITFKRLELKKGAEFRCSLGAIKPSTRPVLFQVIGHGQDGESYPILKRRCRLGPGSWIELKSDLSHLEGRMIKLQITNSWVEESGDASIPPPLVCCGSPVIYSSEVSPTLPKLNLILISLDTLRADHLGCMGYNKPVSPCIDRLAKRSVLFTNIYSNAPYTLASHASLFTSLFPPAHGLLHERDYLPQKMDLLAEILARSGMHTASFNNGGLVSHEFGFSRGFDIYCEVDPIGDRSINGEPFNGNRLADGSAGSLSRAFQWIEELRGSRFFLFLHTFMIHEYIPPEELAESFNQGCPSDLKPGRKTVREKFNKRRIEEHGISPEDLDFFINMYDASIRAADEMVEELIAHLEDLELMEETILVITSDHGDEFMEHGAIRHSMTLYNELLRVPLIIYIPGHEGNVVVDTCTSLIDVMPTILELMEIKNPETLQGQSLIPLITGNSSRDRLVFAVTDLPKRSKRYCVVNKGWKHIEGRTEEMFQYPSPAPVELFNLKKDPREERNWSKLEPRMTVKFKQLLDKIKTDSLIINKIINSGEVQKKTISNALRELLRQQGYL